MLSRLKSNDSYLCVGKILSPFGVGGLIRVKSFTSPKENIFEFANLFVEENDCVLNLKICGFKNYRDKFLVDFLNIDDRSTASLYTNKLIFIKKECLPSIPEDKFYWGDLKGFKVINGDNFELGKVIDFIETGSKDVMRIMGSREIFIPFVWNHYILKVNDREKTIIVDWEQDW